MAWQRHLIRHYSDSSANFADVHRFRPENWSERLAGLTLFQRATLRILHTAPEIRENLWNPRILFCMITAWGTSVHHGKGPAHTIFCPTKLPAPQPWNLPRDRAANGAAEERIHLGSRDFVGISRDRVLEACGADAEFHRSERVASMEQRGNHTPAKCIATADEFDDAKRELAGLVALSLAHETCGAKVQIVRIAPAHRDQDTRNPIPLLHFKPDRQWLTRFNRKHLPELSCSADQQINILQHRLDHPARFRGKPELAAVVQIHAGGDTHPTRGAKRFIISRRRAGRKRGRDARAMKPIRIVEDHRPSRTHRARRLPCSNPRDHK